MADLISKVDVVGIPSTDPDRSREFYVDTLGLRADENARYEFWAGDTCFAIWQPAQFGVEYEPRSGTHSPSRPGARSPLITGCPAPRRSS